MGMPPLFLGFLTDFGTLVHLNKLRQRSEKKYRLLLYITRNHCNKVEGCLGFRFDFWGLGSMWFNKVVQICPKPTKMLLTFGTISPVLIMISTTKSVSFSLLGIHYLIFTCQYPAEEKLFGERRRGRDYNWRRRVSATRCITVWKTVTDGWVLWSCVTTWEL